MYKALDESVSTSEKLAAISDFAFRVWACGLARSDIVGRIDAKTRQFRALCLPLVSCDDAQVDGAINELAEAGLLHLYDVGAHRYAIYHNHKVHNPGMSNLRNQRSRYPEPPADLCRCVRLLAEATADARPHIRPEPEVVAVAPPSPSPAPEPAPAAREKTLTEVETPQDNVEVTLMRLAVEAKCPNQEGTLRKWVRAAIAHSLIGPAKLHQFLMSPEAQGKDVMEWREHFKRQIQTKSAVNMPAAKSEAQAACGICGGSGMRYVEVERRGEKKQAVTPCECVQGASVR